MFSRGAIGVRGTRHPLTRGRLRITSGGAGTLIAKQHALQRAKRTAVPGYTRVSGNYGRFLPRAIGGQQELKFVDSATDLNPLTTAGTVMISSLNLVIQGTGEQQRIGRRIVIKKIQFRFTVKHQSDVLAATSSTSRIMLILDKAANGAVATVSDVLQTASNVYSFNNLSNKNRFVTLMDKYVDLKSEAAAWDGTNDKFGRSQRTIKFFKKGLDIPIETSGTGTPTIANIMSNNLLLLQICDQASTCEITGLVRLRYDG